MDYLLSGEPFDEETCRSLIDRRVKASKDEVMDAVHGYHILEEQKFKMAHAKAHMDFINKPIDEIEAGLFLRSRQRAKKNLILQSNISVLQSAAARKKRSLLLQG